MLNIVIYLIKKNKSLLLYAIFKFLNILKYFIMI